MKRASERPIFIVTLRPDRWCSDPIKALRAVLKRSGRDYGLKCIGLAERPSTTAASTAAVTASSC
jgi:hypothetical protein